MSAVPDWSYNQARVRLLVAGSAALRRHVASARLDDRANRVVDCGCGWTGNSLGWAAHLDHVVRTAVNGTGVAPDSIAG